ncbi:MAG TPA: ABC transporter ATP-binding protein [Streptosporangiaceae bacterium]|nr:ABC transporter ATP-binding protein [Streptosporangiaceae bacterium]
MTASTAPAAGRLLAATGVTKHFPASSRRGQPVTALRSVSVGVEQGVSVGMVGESGSGKTTLLRTLLGLERPSDGEVTFRGTPLADLDRPRRQQYHREVQAVFQDPRSSLDPRERVWAAVTEPAAVSGKLGRAQRRDLAASLLESVDLAAPFLDARPGALSGGEAQRVAIARSLSSQPQVVVLDEPVTSLDASLQGLVLNLLRRLASEAGVTYVVVSHDITPIYHLTQYLYVLYEGMVIEAGATDRVVRSPRHPYTELLVSAVQRLRDQPGQDALRAPRPGSCPFLARCPKAMPQCAGPLPELADPSGGDHLVRCLLWADRPDGAVVAGEGLLP